MDPWEDTPRRREDRVAERTCVGTSAPAPSRGGPASEALRRVSLGGAQPPPVSVVGGLLRSSEGDSTQRSAGAAPLKKSSRAAPAPVPPRQEDNKRVGRRQPDEECCSERDRPSEGDSPFWNKAAAEMAADARRPDGYLWRPEMRRSVAGVHPHDARPQSDARRRDGYLWLD